METEFQQILQQQKDSWNKFSGGWKKWDNLLMSFMRPVADEMISCLQLTTESLVLDIASGTGEPALSIATIVTNGKVTITDIAEDMLDIARNNAAERNIVNIDTKVCDVCALPFEDSSFDAVSCRFGFMFFPDMLLAAKEMVRVLKPGGKLTTAVWDVPQKNFWITAIMDVIKIHVPMPPPAKGAPGMFRCAAPGFMVNLFTEAGLKHVVQQEVSSTLNCYTKETYWENMLDVGAPIVAALSKTTAEQQAKIKQEVFTELDKKFPEGNVNIDASALIICGEKEV